MLFFRPVPSTTSRYMHKLPPATINRSKTVPAKSQMYLSLLRSYMVKSNDIIINISVGFGLKSFKIKNIDIYTNSFKQIIIFKILNKNQESYFSLLKITPLIHFLHIFIQEETIENFK